MLAEKEYKVEAYLFNPKGKNLHGELSF